MSVTSRVRDDFDRIAGLAEPPWDHNSHYHPYLLGRLPARSGDALDVGCGTGAFARLLAGRAERVLALDLSPEMVRRARQRCSGHPNVRFEVAGVMEVDLPPDRFDAVVSIAALHHVPLAEALGRLSRWLRPAGTLLILDLYERSGPIDGLLDLAALPCGSALRLARCRRLRQAEEARRVWAEHGVHDSYMKIGEIRRTALGILPEAVVRRHLLWRYSLAWRKPL